MDNKEFDDIIRERLESLNDVSGGDDWDMFRQKWEERDADTEPNSGGGALDESFDAKVKLNMHSLRMPFNSLHWIQLKARLEAEALFRKKLFVAKTVEILMLSLIVIAVLNIWPIQNDIYRIPVYDIPMVAEVQVEKATAEHYEKQANIQEVKTKKAVKEIFKAVAPSRQVMEIKNIFKPFRQNTDFTPINNIKNSVPNKSKEYKTIKDFHFPFLDIEDQWKENNSEYRDEAVLFASLVDEGPIDQLDIPKRPVGFPDIVLKPKKINSEENSFVSFSIGPKVNLVNSPFDPVYKIDPYNIVNTNFNIAAKLHKELGPVEIYAGLGYHNTSYKPLIVNELYNDRESQYSETSLENIKFRTFNIPVGVKYNLVERPGFQVYAAAGVDVNLIAETEYQVRDVKVGNRANPAPSPPSSFALPQNGNVNERSLLSQKEFNSGILDGGALRDNLYASANVGVGFIKTLTSNSSLFVEPKYNHFISSKGIGPNFDKVHGVSIDIGVRFQLN